MPEGQRRRVRKSEDLDTVPTVTLRQLQASAGDEFLFHYTDAARADAIIEERCFVSGSGVARGLGIYATDIAPSGMETIEDVIVHCFGGDATPRR